MFARLHSKLRLLLADFVSQLLGRQTAGVPPRFSGPPGCETQAHDATPDYIPRSPEEAVLLNQMQPVALIRRRVVVRIGRDGTIPIDAETVKVCPQGRIIVRTETTFLDDFNRAGRAEDIEGVCESCQRVSLSGKACSNCSAFTCDGCLKPLSPQQPIQLCPECIRLVSRDHWAMFDQQHKSGGQDA